MDSYGTPVPADGYYGTSTTGTVSVIDTANPSAAVGSIAVGLHPTAMYVQDKGALFVANTNSDTVSVIDTQEGQGRADDRDQAVAVVGRRVRAHRHRDDRRQPPAGHARPRERRRRLPVPGQAAGAGELHRPAADGLLPGDVATVGDQIVVTNTRGIDARGPNLSFNKGPGTTVAVGHGTHSTTASLTRFTLPTRQGHRRGLHRHGLRPERLGQRTTSSRPSGKKAAAGGGPGAHRRPVDDQARLPARQGEPHLRPGLRRHPRGQRRPDAWRSSARRSRRTSTRWPSSSVSTTTPTTSARTPPRATTG